jgi:hypothetical protein
MTEEQFAEMGKAMQPKVPKDLTYKLTYCAFGDHKFFCEWDAPSKKTLEEGLKSLNMPFDGVYPVKLFEMATGKWS